MSDTPDESPGSTAPVSPRRIGGRYELGELLGRGGMAEVQRALDTRLNRPVAIKQLRADLATDPTFQARFRREAQAAAGLNHPTIVAVYDTGEEPNPVTGVRVPYIVMELVEGVTLRDVLRDGRKILPERALELAAGVLDALSYSHKAGIVHRDIKPANVMLTPTGEVKVMDFGIARALADTTSAMTQTAAVIGTAQYLSPEQARGETVDARSDIYSAGCLLYELLTGRPPFVGESPVSVAYQHVREEAVPPSELDSEVTSGMDAVVMRALAKDPNERYQSARQMKDDLLRLLHGHSPIALATMPTSAVTPGERPTTVLVPDHAPPAAVESTRIAAPAMGATGVSGAAAAMTNTRLTPVPTAEAEEPEPTKRTGTFVIIGLIVLALIATALGGYYVLGPGSAPRTPSTPTPTITMVSVPGVINFTKEQATNSLQGAGLEVKVVEVAGADDSSVGQVTKQDPAANASVPEGSTVEITINVGPKKAEIPLVVGKAKGDAENDLKQAGFTKITFQYAETEPSGTAKDTVLSVTPAERTSVAVGTDVIVELATGKGTVPNFNGMVRERVQEEATAQGFEVTFIDEPVENGNNTAIRQNPEANTKADWGSTIEVVIGVPMPPSTPASPPASETPPSTPESSPTPGG